MAAYGLARDPSHDRYRTDAPPARHLQPASLVQSGGAIRRTDRAGGRGVLIAIAPIVGTARVASATGKIVDALDIALDVADVVAQSEE